MPRPQNARVRLLSRGFTLLPILLTALGWPAVVSSFLTFVHHHPQQAQATSRSGGQALRRCSRLPRKALAVAPPVANPQGVENRLWQWRGQSIRYQMLGEKQDGPSVLLVHGLFVNADHWRQNMPALAAAGFRVFAIDLLGYGYSSKPAPYGSTGKSLNGENGRDLQPKEAEIGAADGTSWRKTLVELKHPLGSPYNFYTWSEQLRDFTKEVIGAQQTTLVANSIGSISALQAAIDDPDLYNGVFIVNPNFRELHVTEQPDFLVPVTTSVQSLLREYGKGLFDFLATPDTVTTILKEPYYNASQVTPELVDVLLTPLLIEGSAEVVFDTLSYSAGPLPEQQLADPGLRCPVRICWGEEDPWTPCARVRALERFSSVDDVLPLKGIGHCPHDEAPDVVNPLIINFVQNLHAQRDEK
mmetsp:Transcript_32010/g.75040  ORF Transcript_32010/g.75040 Transcript_32010/m.75040 type:complete len:415 (+) Transcript_32010:52-1296(+)